MASASQTRQIFDDLQSKYSRLASDLEYQRGHTSRQAAAYRKPIIDLLTPLIRQEVTSLDAETLRRFDGPEAANTNGLSISEYAASIKRQNTINKDRYAELAAFDKGRDIDGAVLARSGIEQREINARRTIKRYQSALEPIEQANRFLRHMKMPEITPETAREYSFGDMMRWLRDPGFRAARQAVNEFEKRMRRDRQSGRLADILTAYDTAKTEIAAAPKALQAIHNEVQAIHCRKRIKDDAVLIREVQARVIREAHKAGYVAHLAAQPFTAGKLDPLLGDAVKADALDNVADSLSGVITAARSASRQFGDSLPKLRRAERENRNGRVRGVDIYRLEANFRRFDERARAGKAVAGNLTEGITNFTFDPPKQSSSQGYGTTQMMYLTLAAAVLMTLDGEQQSLAAGQLTVSGDDFKGLDLGAGIGVVGSGLSAGLNLGIADAGLSSGGIHVDPPRDLDAGSTSFGFGLGGLD